MPWTQAQLDALDEAIASGSLVVRHGDKAVTYRSFDEMVRIRDRIVAQLKGSVTERHWAIAAHTRD